MANLNIENLNIKRIKPLFIKRELLAEIAADSIAKLNPNDKIQKRWISAIGKAVAMIEARNKMSFDLESHTLTIHGSKGDVYEANGVCQCKAFAEKMPCYHRAASRLMLRYAEMMSALPF